MNYMEYPTKAERIKKKALASRDTYFHLQKVEEDKLRYAKQRTLEKAKGIADTLWENDVKNFILEYMQRTVTIYSKEVISWNIIVKDDHINIMVLCTNKLNKYKTEIVGNRLNYFTINEETVGYLRCLVIQYFNRAFTQILIKSTGEILINLKINPNDNYLYNYKEKETGKISEYWKVYKFYSISDFSPKIIDPEEQEKRATFFAKLHRRKPVKYAEEVAKLGAGSVNILYDTRDDNIVIKASHVLGNKEINPLIFNMEQETYYNTEYSKKRIVKIIIDYWKDYLSTGMMGFDVRILPISWYEKGFYYGIQINLYSPKDLQKNIISH